MDALIKITSKDNANIKAITSLQKSPKNRREEGIFVLEGLRLCTDALNNGFTPVKVFFSSSAINKLTGIVELFLACSEKYEVSDSVFTKISDTVNPQGILCLFEIPKFNNNIIDKKGKYIALERIQDPSNLGAISRTAEAFGIDGLILEDCTDPFSSKSLRASMGALLRIPVIETDNMFELFKQHSLTAYASVVLNTAKSIVDMDFKDGSVVIIGNEANGISDYTKENSDHLFTIPMSGKAESLNAAVAASIIIWEMCK